MSLSDLYVDPTTGEYVAEHETPCLLEPGGLHRHTEWFDDQRKALAFARTGTAAQPPATSL